MKTITIKDWPGPVGELQVHHNLPASPSNYNACLARNYDPVIETGVGERVDTLYEIHVSSGSSGLSFCLCRDCLCKLVGEAYLACNPGGTTKEETT